MTIFTLYLPLAVSSFSVKLRSFELASKFRNSLHYSHLCTNCFKRNANLTFAVNAILNLSIAQMELLEDGAYFCYCAYVLRISIEILGFPMGGAY